MIPNENIEEIAAPEAEEEHIERDAPQETQTAAQIDAEVRRAVIEDLAREHGWAPQEEFRGDKNKWVDAKDYLDRSSLRNKISEKSREIKDLTKVQKDMLEVMAKQTELLNREKLDAALKKKREAIEEGDVAKVEQYEREYGDLQKEQEKIDKLKSYNQNPPNDQEMVAEKAFAERNRSWFNQESDLNKEMSAHAIGLDTKLSIIHPDWGIDKRLYEVERMTKEYFYSNAKEKRGPTVESRTGAPSRSRKPTYNDLTPTQKQVVDRFMRTGLSKHMTRDQYAEQIYIADQSGGS